jgi:hypothetical protein
MRLKTAFVAALLLTALPSSAAAKSEFGLRLGDSIKVQGELAPTLFAGNPCVEVVAQSRGDGSTRDEAGITEIEADREYWQMVMFADAERAALEASKPTLIVRDLATGDEFTTTAGTVEGNGTDPYVPLSIRFPHAGRWTVTLDDGGQSTYDYSDGIVISTFHGSVGTPVEPAELEALGNPSDCTDPSPTPPETDEGSLVLPIVIALGAVGALALVVRRARAA